MSSGLPVETIAYSFDRTTLLPLKTPLPWRSEGVASESSAQPLVNDREVDAGPHEEALSLVPRSRNGCGKYQQCGW